MDRQRLLKLAGVQLNEGTYWDNASVDKQIQLLCNALIASKSVVKDDDDSTGYNINNPDDRGDLSGDIGGAVIACLVKKMKATKEL